MRGASGGGAPERRRVDAGVEVEARERLRERLARDAVERQRDRVDGARDQVGAGAGGLDRRGERRPRRALEVDADRQPARLAQLPHELPGAVRLERARRVVEEHARGAEARQARRLLDERLGLPGDPGAVDEPGLELAPGGGDRLGGPAQVLDVVERVVEAEDVDPVRGGGGDEAADDVRVHRPRADEEAAAQRERQGRRRPRPDRADALPRALETAAHGRVEAAAARDLEVGVAGRVEELGHAQQRRRREAAGERLLAEQAHGGVDEARHRPRAYRRGLNSRRRGVASPPLAPLRRASSPTGHGGGAMEAHDEELPRPDDPELPIDDSDEPETDESENPDAVVPPGYEAA
jgi:hypothetical protein